MRNLKFNDFERIDKSLIEELSKFASSNIGDNLDRNAALSSSIRPINSVKMAGQAFTIKVSPGDNLYIFIGLELAQEGDILVIDAEGFEDRAVIG